MIAILAQQVIAGVLGSIIKQAVEADPSAPDKPDPEAMTEEAAAKAASAIESHMHLLAQDAASADRFRSGWRPAFGWVGVLGTAYEFFLRPLATWGGALRGWPPLPPIPPDALWPLVGGLLGVAGLRTYEKRSGVDATVGAAIDAVTKGIIKRTRR